MRLGIIDIGSNTVRLVIWDIYGKGYYRIVDEIKENVRIGESLEEDYFIDEEKIVSLLDVLKRFDNFNKSLRTEKVITVASEAIINSANKDDIIKRIKNETSLDPIVLDDTAKSHLDFFGVTNSMMVENSLMIDISGTTTEMMWIVDNEQKEYAYLPFGTINLTRKFRLNQLVTKEDHIALEKFLLENLSNIPWLKEAHFKTIILVGGSARTIGRIDRYRKRYPLSITHNYSLSDLDIDDMYYKIMTKDVNSRNKILGLNKDRSDIILGALAILHIIHEVSKVEEYRISGKGLREGILYEWISENMETHDNMLDSTIYSILARHKTDLPHAEQVFKLSNRIYDQMTDILKLNRYYKDILKCAALLHDVGSSIRYYDHEKHSFYIILNSEINGLNHKEILMSALSASYHRNNNMDLTITMYSQLINKLDSLIAERIGLIISIAESFDKSMNQLVSDITVSFDDEKVIFTAYSDSDLTTEIKEAYHIEDKFQEIFGRKLIVEQANQ